MSINQQIGESATTALNLFKKYSIKPPDMAMTEKTIENPMHGGKSVSRQFYFPEHTDVMHEEWAVPPEHRKSGGITTVGHKQIDPGHKIFHVDFTKDPHDGSFLDMKVLAGMDDDRGFPKAYFLPWRPGNVVEISIPKFQDGDEDAPHLFFTSALSGCTVIFRGTPQEPIVLHAGVETHQIKGSLHQRFWEFLTQSLPGGQVPMHKGYYLGDDIEMLLIGMAQRGQGEDIRVVEAKPWGTVFGLREGSDWTFYLQENATIVYHKILGSKITTKKSWFGLQKTRISELIIEEKRSRQPMFLVPMFPRGSHIAKMDATLKILT